MKILMVCKGNICRSPMAEGLARHLVQDTGLNVTFDSAGTHAYHVGQAPDKRAQAEMQRHGINISHLRARVFERDDFARFDVIMVADTHNAETILQMASNANERAKVIKMLDAGIGCHDDVSDPYYGGEEGFNKVYQQLHSALKNYLERL